MRLIPHPMLAEEVTSVYYEFSRLHAMSQWWHWLLLLAVCAAIVTWIAVAYYFDSSELPRGRRWLLFILRTAAFAGILFYFLDLEKRSERKLVKDSRVLMLVDTSQSMGLSDSDATSVPAGPSRIEHVVGEFEEGTLLDELRAAHDVLIYRFDQGSKPLEIGVVRKRPAAGDQSGDDVDPAVERSVMLRQARWTAGVAGGLLLLSLIAGAAAVLTRRFMNRDRSSWAVLVAVVAAMIAVVLLAIAHLRSPGVPLAAIVGLEEFDPRRATDGEEDKDQADALPERTIDWKTELLPRGLETRLGEALRAAIAKERGGPIAGIVVFSDGRNNAGVDVSTPISAAQAAGIPVYTVGLGSDRRPINVRVVDLEAPPRVYPGDRFTLTGYLQSYGLTGRTVRVELLSQPGEGGGRDNEVYEDEERVLLSGDGEMVPLQFEVTPAEEGTRTYKLRVEAPPQDFDQRDNEKTAKVEIVQEEARVLLLASGPTREYRFLRNLLFRDRDTTLHVLLQSGQPGMSQESDELLYSFPATAEELFEYDCIVAFDPDWQSLEPGSIELLDRWVAEGAGGLIVIAGPVFTPQWSRVQRGSDPQLDIIKALYPVNFFTRGSPALSLSRFEAETPWPLQFTREGTEAPFLWLEDEPLASEQSWASFGGVFGYFAVNGAKPGARVFAHFADPTTAIDGQLPIYMAGHFYGAGRVFFQASGEMWRVRAMEEAYFEKYYTKLIRWASEGRLLRDSSRGVLLVDKDRALLGDSVGVRAMLTDPQHRPLTQDKVTAVLLHPDSTRTTVELEYVRDAARDGMYAGQFTALQEGDYHIELPVPQTADQEVLTRDVRVRVPTLEIEQPERHDALLKQLAQRTGGTYYVGVPATTRRGAASSGVAPLASVIEPQDQVTFLPGTPDRQFEQKLMGWLMVLVAGALCVEWLIRRLSRLA